MPAKTFPAPYGSDYNDNVPISTPTLRATLRTPCPQCGYDLRGHTDPGQCPECGRFVCMADEIGIANQWVSAKLIDLWSLAGLQFVGTATIVACRIAFQFEQHYYSVIFGLLAGPCIIAATIWYCLLAPTVCLRLRRPIMAALPTKRIRKLQRWCLVDGVLILAPAMALLL